MPKKISEFARPIPRVQATRPLGDLIRAFQKKPGLDTVLIVAGPIPLGVISRTNIGQFILSRLPHDTLLKDAPKTPIMEVSSEAPIARVGLDLAKTDHAAEIVLSAQSSALMVDKNALLGALALENAARAKALKREKSQTITAPQTDANVPPSPLLRALTHEIRTPLSGMMGLAEVLTERLADNEARDLAQMILESGQNLDRTLRNANEMVREETETDAPELAETDLETLVDDLRENWALLAARQKTRFSIDLSPDGPPRIKCDQARVREMIDNLINNALRFTRSGDIAITLSTQPVDDQPLLSVAISQTGRRLSGAQKQTISKALETGTLGGDIPGWALGLIVSQKTAQKLGGQLTHADNPRGGSVLTLRIPVERAAPRLKPALPTKPMKTGSFDPGTILLVEDHEASALMTITALETAGWAVHHCHSLSDAMRAADISQFQALITDLNLLDGNGLTLIERVRHVDGPNQYIPILSMTAEIGAEKSELALAAGATEALRKPVEGPNLVAMLADLIMRNEGVNLDSKRLRRRLVA